jgi:hypothetical protein
LQDTHRRSPRLAGLVESRPGRYDDFVQGFSDKVNATAATRIRNIENVRTISRVMLDNMTAFRQARVNP